MINKINYNNIINKDHNIKSIAAENKIIALIIKNPDFYKYIKDKLCVDDFSDLTNKKIYNILVGRLDLGLPIDIIHLSNITDESVIKKIAYLIASDLNINLNKDDLISYLKTVKESAEKAKRDFSQMGDEELKDYFEKIKKLKNK